MNNSTGIKKWYANKINKQETEFDEFDLYICKIILEFVNEIDKKGIEASKASEKLRNIFYENKN